MPRHEALTPLFSTSAASDTEDPFDVKIYECQKLRSVGYSVVDLKGGGFTLADILSAGFASADLFACEAAPGTRVNGVANGALQHIRDREAKHHAIEITDAITRVSINKTRVQNQAQLNAFDAQRRVEEPTKYKKNFWRSTGQLEIPRLTLLADL